MPAVYRMVGNKYYQHLMLFFVIAYTITFVPFKDISKIFQTLLILGTLPALWVYRKELLKDRMFQLLIAALCIPLASWLNGLYHIPDLVNSTPKLDRLAKLFTFLLMVIWLKGKVRNTYLLLGSLVVSILLGFITAPDFYGEITEALNGERVDFDLKNAQFTSMFAGSALILSVFGGWVLYHRPLKPALKWPAILLIFLSAAFFTFAAIVSQSRQNWLALLFVVFSLPLILSVFGSIKSYKKVILSYIVLSLSTCLLLLGSSTVQEKILRGDSVAGQILAGDTENLPMTSIGLRINSWVEAGKWISDYPVLGVGSNGPGLVIKESELFQSRISEAPETIKSLRHLHSNHIENLVAYGFLGFSCILAMYILLPLSLYKIRKDIPRELLILAVCFVIYWLIINCFETFNARSYGVFVHNIMFASLYHLYFFRNRHKEGEEQ